MAASTTESEARRKLRPLDLAITLAVLEYRKALRVVAELESEWSINRPVSENAAAAWRKRATIARTRRDQTLGALNAVLLEDS